MEEATCDVDIDPTSQPNWPGPLVDIAVGNHPPQQPSSPSGPTLSATSVTCYYSAYAIDQDGDPLIYIFCWDDGNYSRVGPLVSGTKATIDHTWSRAGTYLVKVRATDNNNSSSNWSSPLMVVVNSSPNRPCIPTGETVARPGENASFFTSAEDPDEDQMRYIFDWGDGSFSTSEWTESGKEVRMEHSWEKAGSYGIATRAEDGSNASSPWSLPLMVVINSPPIQPAILIGGTVAQPGENASFSISGEDPDEDQMQYILDWGDGSVSTSEWTESGKEVRMEHSWEIAGQYSIAAKAEDSRNSRSSWSETVIIIINTLPSRPDQLSGPGSGYAMAPCLFKTSSIDPDGDSLNYSFDWGDGTTDTVDLIGSGFNISSSHVWTCPGTYQIRAIAADRMGGNWSEERSIIIAANGQPDRPRDLYGLRSGFAGNVYNYFIMSRDPDGDTVKYILDWGDGSAAETDYVRSGSLENASHIWSLPGEYKVWLGSIDDKGASSQRSGPFLVTISANDPPEQPFKPSGPATGQRLISHEYATSARDPDGDPVKYIFDWGDGTTSWTGQGYLSSGEESAVSHKWKQPGLYQIKAAALDDKGSISEWSMALRVKIE